MIILKFLVTPEIIIKNIYNYNLTPHAKILIKMEIVNFKQTY